MILLQRLVEIAASVRVKMPLNPCPLSQTPRALMSSLPSFFVFPVLLSNLSPVSGVNFGSISMSLQTSDNIFIVRSLISLCLIDAKPPFLQLKQCLILNLPPQGHVVGKFAMFNPYCKPISSQKRFFDSAKQKSPISSAVSRFDTHFLDAYIK